LTTHPHLAPQGERKGGAIHVLPFCAFMACMGVNFTSILMLLLNGMI